MLEKDDHEKVNMKRTTTNQAALRTGVHPRSENIPRFGFNLEIICQFNWQTGVGTFFFSLFHGCTSFSSFAPFDAPKTFRVVLTIGCYLIFLVYPFLTVTSSPVQIRKSGKQTSSQFGGILGILGERDEIQFSVVASPGFNIT